MRLTTNTTTTWPLLDETLTVTLIPVLNINSGPVMTATIRYIRGTTETIARTLLCILQPYNIHVAHNLITTI